MKAREVKRAKLAQRYAHKREEIAAKVKAGENGKLVRYAKKSGEEIK